MTRDYLINLRNLRMERLAGFVLSSAAVILSCCSEGFGYLADISVMHQLRSGVGFSRAFSSIGFG
jgi:hypothetical protein